MVEQTNNFVADPEAAAAQGTDVAGTKVTGSAVEEGGNINANENSMSIMSSSNSDSDDFNQGKDGQNDSRK